VQKPQGSREEQRQRSELRRLGCEGKRFKPWVGNCLGTQGTRESGRAEERESVVGLKRV
jgi:hypothetical protein